MNIEINRTGKKIVLNKQKGKNYGSVNTLLAEYGYNSINVLDYDNYKNIEWEGIEFNRLFKRDNIIYRFNYWMGEAYPWDGAEIEEIGIERA